MPPPDTTRLLLTAAPLYFFALLCWVVRPTSAGNISLAYLVPFAFLLVPLLVNITREDFTRLARRLTFEFVFLLVLVALTILSLINLNEPFRAFRVLFPSVLPLLLFVQLVALRSISPRAVANLPRFFLLCALLFSTVPLLLSNIYPPLHAKLFITHRLTGFFENANQLSIALATLVPLAIAEIAISKSRRARILWLGVFVLLLYTLLRTGSKTALLVTVTTGWAFYLLVNFRTFSPLKRIAMTFGMVLLAGFIALFGIQIAALIDPILAEKLSMIFNGGVGNYYSIQSRQELWQAAIDQGSQHWLIGTGAGEMILGIPHAHNLILDYFKGVGFFGALAIFLLCVAIVSRTAKKALAIFTRSALPGDIRTLACYLSATVYVICNQLSDCFGPTTIAALWVIYLPAVLSEHCANHLAEPIPKRAKPKFSPHPPVHPAHDPRTLTH